MTILSLKKYPRIIGLDINKELIAQRMKHGFVLYLLLKLKGIITLPLFVALLGAEGLGKYRLILTSVSILIPIISLNLSDGSALFFVNETDEKLIKEKFYSIFFISNILLLFAGCIGLTISYLYYRDVFIDVFLGCALILAMLIHKFGIFLPQVYQKTHFLVLINFLSEFLSIVAAIILILLTGMNYKAAIMGQAFVFSLISIFLFKIIYHNIGFISKIDFIFIKKALRISIPLTPVFLSQWIMNSMDNYFIIYFYDATQVGIYSVSYSICNLIAGILAMINMVWPSTSVKLWNEDKVKYRKIFNIFFTNIYVVMGFVFLVFYLNAYLFIDLFANDKFYAAAFILPAISLAYIFMLLIKVCDCAIYANRNVKYSFISFSVGAVINFILNFLFIPKWNIFGAAMSTLISYGITLLLCLLTIKVKLKLSLNYSIIFKTTILTAIFSLLILLFKLNQLPVLTIIIINLILVICYFGIAFLFNMLSLENFKILASGPMNQFFKFFSRR